MREVQEEISYFVPAERFEYLAEMVGLADSGGSFRSKFYVTRDIPVDALVITEGSLLIVEPEKLISLDQKLTPTARFAIKRLTTEARFLGDRDL